MEHRTLGRTGLSVHPLGLGGAPLGYESINPDQAARLLHSAVDEGLTTLDTAAAYGDSEALIGAALQDRRDEVHLLTKCGPDWSREALEENVQESLRRLGTDRLDLLQLWSPGLAELKRGEIIAFLEEQKEKGRTRFIGLSDDSEAARYGVRTGRFDTLQISVNIADQEAIDEIIPEAVEAGMGVIAKRPIANVAFSDEKTTYFPGYENTYRSRLSHLKYDFLDRPFAEVLARALRFTLTVPGISLAIVGTSRPGRWQENAELAARGPLPEEEYEAIRERWREVAREDWRGQR